MKKKKAGVALVAACTRHGGYGLYAYILLFYGGKCGAGISLIARALSMYRDLSGVMSSWHRQRRMTRKRKATLISDSVTSGGAM